MVNNDYTKEQCEDMLAVEGYAEKLTNALIAEVEKVTQANSQTQHRASIWCGSIIMQIVVEDLLSQLQQHYSGGNELVLQIDGVTSSFAPVTTTAEPMISSTSTRADYACMFVRICAVVYAWYVLFVCERAYLHTLKILIRMT